MKSDFAPDCRGDLGIPRKRKKLRGLGMPLVAVERLEPWLIHVEKESVFSGEKTFFHIVGPLFRGTGDEGLREARDTSQRVFWSEDGIDRKTGPFQKRRHMHVALPEAVHGQKKTRGIAGRAFQALQPPEYAFAEQ